jgi:ribonuclease-3
VEGSLDTEQLLPTLEGYVGHTFSDRSLLLVALSHRSFANEHAPPLPDNQLLEFLGDAVLQLAVTHLLMENDDASHSEGVLTLLRSQLVSEARLARFANEIELGRFLRLGRGEEMNGGRKKPSLLADAFEALFGALYRDAGFSAVLAVARRLLSAEIARVAASRTLDFKSALQERIQAQKKDRPRYQIVSSDGPDHERVFVVAVFVEDFEMGRGEGRSKREAELQAAKQALQRLDAESSAIELD